MVALQIRTQGKLLLPEEAPIRIHNMFACLVTVWQAGHLRDALAECCKAFPENTSTSFPHSPHQRHRHQEEGLQWSGDSVRESGRGSGGTWLQHPGHAWTCPTMLLRRATKAPAVRAQGIRMVQIMELALTSRRRHAGRRMAKGLSASPETGLPSPSKP